jgi:hypothetical protein
MYIHLQVPIPELWAEQRSRRKHHETNRLAHFSPHLFDAASIYWRGTEDYAGAAASLHDSRDDTYTQAVTTEKRKAQEDVVALLFPGKTQER